MQLPISTSKGNNSNPSPMKSKELDVDSLWK
jgi:hypothetical protein